MEILKNSQIRKFVKKEKLRIKPKAVELIGNLLEEECEALVKAVSAVTRLRKQKTISPEDVAEVQKQREQ